MPPKGEKRAFHSVTLDILSNLPDNVTDDILIHLPLRDAVKTSILSKKWRYKWCKLPELTLDQTLWKSRTVSVSTLTFAEIVSHLFIRHEGPITKFSLFIPDLGRCAIFDNLIYFLSRKNIQHLVLQLPNGYPYYKLPASFFTCLQLRYMALKNCLICPPPDFKGFDKLIGLELCEVTISSETLESFISHSPLLKYLVLEISDNISNLEITAPNLKSFGFTGNGSSLSLIINPLLEKLSLVNFDLIVEPGKSDLAILFESYPALKHLHLDHYSLENLFAGADEVPKQLPAALNYLTQLHLSDYFIHQPSALRALCLIRSCPYLQDLEIQMFEDYDSHPGDVPAVESFECFSDMALNHLRAVKLKGISGTQIEMAFIKLLLATSPVLVRMLIEPRRRTKALEARHKILVELTKFLRTSPKAEVVFKAP